MANCQSCRQRRLNHPSLPRFSEAPNLHPGQFQSRTMRRVDVQSVDTREVRTWVHLSSYNGTCGASGFHAPIRPSAARAQESEDDGAVRRGVGRQVSDGCSAHGAWLERSASVARINSPAARSRIGRMAIYETIGVDLWALCDTALRRHGS